jgi:hypothetical protein
MPDPPKIINVATVNSLIIKTPCYSGFSAAPRINIININ